MQTIYSKKFPENKPTVSGYYPTAHIHNGNVYFKCLYWVQEKKSYLDRDGNLQSIEQCWVKNDIPANVICYWDEIREDYYGSCYTKTLEFQLKHNDWESIITPHKHLLTARD